MKAGKLNAVIVAGIIGLSSVSFECQASFKDKVQDAADKVKAKIEQVRQKLKDHVNSPEVQMRLAEIRAEHREMLKNTLQKALDAWLEYKDEIRPLVRARLQLKIEELKLKVAERIRFLRKRAQAKYEAKIDEIISGLPDNVEAVVRQIRESERYQEAKAKIGEKIRAALKKKGEELKEKYEQKVRDHINEKVAELETKLQDFINNI
jgi:uncharacterized membrane-anchored protein YhcB (DUF1043 family)